MDPEITSQAGPQLVVPVMNARFALNAANARWGSLYDSLYGTNVIAEENHAQKTKQYNPERGAKVVQYGKEFLDRSYQKFYFLKTMDCILKFKLIVIQK